MNEECPYSTKPPRGSRSRSAGRSTTVSGRRRRPGRHYYCLTILVFWWAMVVDIAALLSAHPSSGISGGISDNHNRIEYRPAATTTGFGVARTHPTQTTRKPRRTPQKEEGMPRRSRASFLVPSQVLGSHNSDAFATPEPHNQTDPAVAAGANNNLQTPTKSGNPNQKRKRRRNKKKPAVVSPAAANHHNHNNHNGRSNHHHKAKQQPRKSGNLPDIYWRSVPMEDLRLHPRVEALPLPGTITELADPEDVRWFRQESWQWDALHRGRCTTSQAVAALGFLEPEAGTILGVPRSWQRGGLGAYHRLQQTPLRTLGEMNAVLCEGNGNNNDDDDPAPEGDGRPPVWTRPPWTADGREFPFAAKYMVPVTDQVLAERRSKSRAMSGSPGFDSRLRMMWGNAQEATALLTALNHFSREDPGLVLREVGMCGAGLALNATTEEGGGDGLLVGATPDGLLCYSDGRIEALEVKNHCPFFSHNHHNRRSSSSSRPPPRDRFFVRHFDFQNAGVPPHYIPQVLMEMLCVGPACRSTVLVRQSATSGALVLRVHRDDAWIDEMLYWLHRFQADFVRPGIPPPTNFFLRGGSSEEDRARYSRFLEWTGEIRSAVEVVDHIPHSRIQRALGTRPGLTSLFLDG